jgi:putative heme iron utilization protein
MAHLSRLDRELAEWLGRRRVAALGTLDDDGAPLVSMVPFAIAHGAPALVIHVSDLAAHTRHLLARPRVSLLVVHDDRPDEPVHALPRISLAGRAEPLVPGSPEAQACREAYLGRFPEALPMTELADFRFVAVRVSSARHVAGFAAARSLDEAQVGRVLAAAAHPV